MPYLALRDVSAPVPDDSGSTEMGHAVVHRKGAVLSDRDLPETVRTGIKNGNPWMRLNFEPLTDSDARKHRVRATVAEGNRLDGQTPVAPPWEDYVGLSPHEIFARLKDAPVLVAEQVRAYERGGLNRTEIAEFAAPAEREPFLDYNDLSVREVLGKLEMMGGDAVQDVIAYEVAHRARPAIVSFEPELIPVGEPVA